jgi:hypothetical protein
MPCRSACWTKSCLLAPGALFHAERKAEHADADQLRATTQDATFWKSTWNW